MKPEDLDRAERAALGGAIRWPDTIGQMVADVRLRPEHFRTHAHQRVFAALVALWEAGKPVDLTSVADVLLAQHAIDDIGGYPYLGQLWEEQPTGAAAVHHAGIVRRRAIVRELNAAGKEIAAETAAGDGDAEQLLAAAERRIFAIAQKGGGRGAVRLDRAAAEVFDRIDCRARRGDQAGRLATGLLDLDEVIAGLHDSELVILGARPGVGKSSFALQVAKQAAVERGLPALIVSLEMSRVELTERLLCSVAGVDGSKLRKGRPSRADVDGLGVARQEVLGAPLFIDDEPQQRTLQIAATARRLKLQEGLRLLVVDYVQLIEPDNRKDPRQEQVSQSSRRLKQLAKELNIPVLALAQLNRGAEEADAPKLSHLRESGSLEQDADVVLLMHQPEGEPNVVELNVAKNRNGPIGAIKLTFCKPLMRFENYAGGMPPPGVG